MCGMTMSDSALSKIYVCGLTVPGGAMGSVFRRVWRVEHVGEFRELGSSQWLSEHVGEVVGGLDVLQGEDLVGNVILEMVVPNVYKFAAFAACAVVADLDGCIIVDVE